MIEEEEELQQRQHQSNDAVLQTRVKELERLNDSLQDELRRNAIMVEQLNQSLVKERDAHESSRKDLKHRITVAECKSKSLREEIKTGKKLQKELNDRISELELRNNDLKEELRSQDYKKMEKRIADLEERNETLRRNREAHAQEKATLQARIAELEGSVKPTFELEKQLKNLQEEKEKQDLMWQNRLAMLESQKNSLQDERDTMEHLMLQLADKVSRPRKRLDSTERERILCHDVRTLRAELKAWYHERQKLLKTVAQLEDQLLDLKLESSAKDCRLQVLDSLLQSSLGDSRLEL